MQKFLRLALVVTLGVSCAWPAPKAHSASTETTFPMEVPMQLGDGMPTVEVQLKDVVKLGRYEFSEATIVYPALGDVANVGLRVLSQFVITFDQKHERFRLKRA